MIITTSKHTTIL